MIKLSIAFAAALLAQGCFFEPCFDAPTHVYLESSAEVGIAPMSVRLVAESSGRACGCCGGEAPREIVAIEWDLDSDGVTDVVGEDVVELTLDQAGSRVVTVTVVDDQGARASDVVTLEALSIEEDPQAILDRFEIEPISERTPHPSCYRNECFRVRSQFGSAVDTLTFTSDKDGEEAPLLIELDGTEVSAEAWADGEVLLCDGYDNTDTGLLTLTLRIGDAERTETAQVFRRACSE